MSETRTVNSFTTWTLSEEDTLNGQILTPLQEQVIQNELAQVAEQKINLDYDPRNPIAFAQTEAMLKGQMQVLRLLLDRSSAASDELKRLATLKTLEG